MNLNFKCLENQGCLKQLRYRSHFISVKSSSSQTTKSKTRVYRLVVDVRPICNQSNETYDDSSHWIATKTI